VAVGRTRRITRKQALAYERSVPNGSGVTAIASVNGRGAYASRGADYAGRYDVTRRMLRNEGPFAPAGDDYVPRVREPFARATDEYVPRRRVEPEYREPAHLERTHQQPFRSAADYERSLHVRPARQSRGRIKGIPIVDVYEAREPEIRGIPIHGIREGSIVMIGGEPHVVGGRKKAAKKKKAAKNKPKKRARSNSRAEGTRMATNKKAAKKGAAKRKTTRRKAPKGRTFAKGKYRAVGAKVGKRTFRTYAYASKKGVHKVPLWAMAGAGSAKDWSGIASGKVTGKHADAVMKRLGKIRSAREKAAARVAAGKSIFYPNAPRVVSYEDFRNMNENKKGAAKKKKAKKAAAKKPDAKHTKKGKTSKKSAKKGHSSKKVKTHAKSLIKQIRTAMKGYEPKKKAKARRKSARKGLGAVGNYFRNPGAGALLPIIYANKTRRKHAKRARPNRKHHRKTHRGHARRNYHRNGFSPANLMAGLKTAFKAGGIAAIGFLGHRAATKLLDTYVLSKVSMLNAGALAGYRPLISGLIAAVAAIPLVDAAAAKQSQQTRDLVKAGVLVSFLHGAIVSVLTATGQAKIAGYFGAYPQVYSGYGDMQAAAGYGEYMPMGGYGEYMEMGPGQRISGYGSYGDMQAAAGYGDMQAAAGYGDLQAAAGMGEFFSTGVSGYGEYMETGTSGIGAYGVTDEGIAPDLRSAEWALSVAEATSGIGGFGDVGTISTVNPSDMALPVTDVPQGMRTGILEGGDGIFGG